MDDEIIKFSDCEFYPSEEAWIASCQRLKLLPTPYTPPSPATNIRTTLAKADVVVKE